MAGVSLLEVRHSVDRVMFTKNRSGIAGLDVDHRGPGLCVGLRRSC